MLVRPGGTQPNFKIFKFGEFAWGFRGLPRMEHMDVLKRMDDFHYATHTDNCDSLYQSSFW